MNFFNILTVAVLSSLNHYTFIKSMWFESSIVRCDSNLKYVIFEVSFGMVNWSISRELYVR